MDILELVVFELVVQMEDSVLFRDVCCGQSTEGSLNHPGSTILLSVPGSCLCLLSVH